MKKFLLIIMFLSAICFIQAQDISVHEVIGKVEIQVNAFTWKEVTLKTKLFPKSFIKTGINSTLVITMDSKIYSFKSMSKDTVENLIIASMTKDRIKIGAKITESNITSDADVGRTNISTAATRAATKEDDIEWK